MEQEGTKEELDNEQTKTDSGTGVEVEKKELTKEEQELLERALRDKARTERVLYRQQIIKDWASNRVNFIAIILLFFFALLIIFSYLLRPPTPAPTLKQPQSTNTNTKPEGQKN